MENFFCTALVILLATCGVGIPYKQLAREPQVETSLPVIEILLDPGEALYEKEFSPATATWFDGNGKMVFHDSSLNIRYRGNGTYVREKKPYKLKFAQAVNLVEEENQEAREWVLLADYNDRALLRNYTALSLAKVFDNLEYTVDFQLVEMVLNEEHMGTFLLTEQIEVSSTTVNIDEKAGDILLERSLLYDEMYTIMVDGGLGKDVPYDVASKVYDMDQLQRAEEIIVNIESALNSGEQGLICQYVDMDSCVDYYLIQEFMKNTDVGYGSSFMYIYANEDKLYFGPPWDFDWSSGTDLRYGIETYYDLYVGNAEINLYQSHHWFQKLMQMDWFQQMVVARWNEKKTEVQGILEHVKVIAQDYEIEFQRNLDLWSLNKLTYAEYFEDFSTWTTNRYDWLDGYLNELEF